MIRVKNAIEVVNLVLKHLCKKSRRTELVLVAILVHVKNSHLLSSLNFRSVLTRNGEAPLVGDLLFP